MYILESQTYLNKPIEDLSFAEELIVINFTLDMIAQIAHLTVLHYYDEHLQREITLLIRHDVWMIQVLQKIDFKHSSFLFLLFQTRQHNLFGYVLFSFRAVVYEICSSYNTKGLNIKLDPTYQSFLVQYTESLRILTYIIAPFLLRI